MSIKKELRAQLARDNRQYSNALEQVPKEKWPQAPAHSPPLFQVLRSRHFLVMVFCEQKGVFRLSICRTAVDGSGNWKSDISWDELQQLKNEAGFEDFDAIEIYPRAADIVNVANMRHLWIHSLMPQLALTWRDGFNEGCKCKAPSFQQDGVNCDTCGKTASPAGAPEAFLQECDETNRQIEASELEIARAEIDTLRAQAQTDAKTIESLKYQSTSEADSALAHLDELRQQLKAHEATIAHLLKK